MPSLRADLFDQFATERLTTGTWRGVLDVYSLHWTPDALCYRLGDGHQFDGESFALRWMSMKDGDEGRELGLSDWSVVLGVGGTGQAVNSNPGSTRTRTKRSTKCVGECLRRDRQGTCALIDDDLNVNDRHSRDGQRNVVGNIRNPGAVARAKCVKVPMNGEPAPASCG